MANARPKPRPMRSRRSGVKKFKQYMANWEVLKKLGAFCLIAVLFSSCVVLVRPHKRYYHRPGYMEMRKHFGQEYRPTPNKRW